METELYQKQEMSPRLSEWGKVDTELCLTTEPSTLATLDHDTCEECNAMLSPNLRLKYSHTKV